LQDTDKTTEKTLRNAVGVEKLGFATTLKPQLAILKRSANSKHQPLIDRMLKSVADTEEQAKKDGITLAPTDTDNTTPVLTRTPNTPQSSSPSTHDSAVGEVLDQPDSTADTSKQATPGFTPGSTSKSLYPEVRVQEI
jgi:hypothetical protein